jgi:hypothetical protein
VSFGDDSITFLAAPAFTGTDSFTYEIGDLNGGRTTATVTVRVDPPAIPRPTDQDGSDEGETSDPDDQPTGNENGNGENNNDGGNDTGDDTGNDNDTGDDSPLQPVVSLPGLGSAELPEQQMARATFQQNFSDEELASAEILRDIEDPDLAQRILLGISQERAAGIRGIEFSGFGTEGPSLITQEAFQLWKKLERFSTPVGVNLDIQVSIGAITVLGTFGGILWAVRGGTLMAVAFTQLPSWNFIDPLPILDGHSRRKDNPQSGAEDLGGFF